MPRKWKNRHFIQVSNQLELHWFSSFTKFNALHSIVYCFSREFSFWVIKIKKCWTRIVFLFFINPLEIHLTTENFNLTITKTDFLLFCVIVIGRIPQSQHVGRRTVTPHGAPSQSPATGKDGVGESARDSMWHNLCLICDQFQESYLDTQG